MQPPRFSFENYNDTPILEEDTMTTRSNAPQGINRRTFLKAGAAMSAAVPLWSISRRASGRARVFIQARHRSGPDPSRQYPRAGSDQPHSRGDQRPPRYQAVPAEPARLRHRPALAGAQRRRRVLQPGLVDSRDARAGRGHRQYRLRVQGLRRGVEGDGRRPRQLYPSADRQVGHRLGEQGHGTTASVRSVRRPVRCARPPT